MAIQGNYLAGVLTGWEICDTILVEEVKNGRLTVNNDEQLHCRLPGKVKRELEQCAVEERRSVGAVVRTAVVEYLDRRKENTDVLLRQVFDQSDS